MSFRSVQFPLSKGCESVGGGSTLSASEVKHTVNIWLG